MKVIATIGVGGFGRVELVGHVYPHMPIGMLGIYVVHRFFSLSVCPQIFCNGYLRRGLQVISYFGELWPRG